MRYDEGFDEDSDGNPVAAVYARHVHESSDTAHRHARAMAAVLRASKASGRALAAYMRATVGSGAALTRYEAANARLDRAVARLEKVEKEVGRG